MNSNSRASRFQVLAVAATAILLSSCGQQSNWSSLNAEGHRLEQSGDLNGAIAKYRLGIEAGLLHQVPDKLYYAEIKKVGQTLAEQGKDTDAIPYLVRALQLGSAVQMSLGDNIKLLHQLAHAEANTKDWTEAAATQKTLLTLLEVEKGPWTPELAEERQFNGEIETQLIAIKKSHQSKVEHEEKVQELSDNALGGAH